MNIYNTSIGRFYLNETDLVSKYIIDNGKWEEELFPVFDKYLNKESNVIEVGAYIGDHTVYLSKLCNLVFSIEADQNNYLQLVNNLFLNECFHNVAAYNVAIYTGENVRKVKQTDNWCTSPETNAAGLRLIPDSSGEIKTYRLDDFFTDHVLPIHMIKTDTEGMDLHVLKSGINIIRKYNPILIYEFNGLVAKENGHTIEDYDNFIKEIGYKSERISQWNWLARKDN